MDVSTKVGVGSLCLIIFVLLLTSGVAIGQRDDLRNKVKTLQVENQTLQHNLDIANTPITDDVTSPEIEALNTIGQAIANSKSVDLTIETEGGKVHFVYEAK